MQSAAVPSQIDPDPVFTVAAVFILVLIFALYLLLRRTFLGFMEGLKESGDGKR